MVSRFNIHTHTCLCHHASGTVEEYCQAAIAEGVQGVGFTDHGPFPDGRWGGERMSYEELGVYVSSVRSASVRHAGELEVLLGVECEYVPAWRGYLHDELLGHLGMDYLLGAPHYYRVDGSWVSSFAKRPMDDSELLLYTEHVVSALCSGLFRVYAHPDLLGFRYRGWSHEASACCREICRAAVSQGVYLEINGKGMRREPVMDDGELRAPYPVRRFWEIAREEGVKCYVGSDAHVPSDIWGNNDACIALARACDLEPCNAELWGILSGGGGRLHGGVQ